MISALLLTAGFSERFGSPKALAPLTSSTCVIEHLQKALLDSPVDDIVIVLGADAQKIKPRILKNKRIRSVINADYHLGQTSSFQKGLKHLSLKTRGVLLLPVDYPFIKTDTIHILCDQFLLSPSKIMIPSFNGRKGHPPIFPISLKKDFLALDHSQGINTVAQEHQSAAVIYPVDDSGVIKSFNTPEEFKKIKNS